MRLISARVTNYKSIEDSGSISIEPDVTVLVGQNEAGKSAVLEAIHKSNPGDVKITYNVTRDYPRKNLTQYKRKAAAGEKAVVLVAEYALNPTEVIALNDILGFIHFDDFTFSWTHKYEGSSIISQSGEELNLATAIIKNAAFRKETTQTLDEGVSLSQALDTIRKSQLTPEEEQEVGLLQEKYIKDSEWPNSPIQNYIWREFLKSKIPKYLYFDDYKILEDKINFKLLKEHEENDKLTDSDQTALSLLTLASVSLEEMVKEQGYEEVKAQLEGLSNTITDHIFNYWKQNTELEVEFDIREDPQDDPPYNSGSNLYIRIKNSRHRVTVPFGMRSKGFIWFFSFVVWFESVKNLHGTDSSIALLLDEPGLNLHALAQKDFLDYINKLSDNHQVVYTTHSPFMVDSAALHKVRVVEDLKEKGTVVSGDLIGPDDKSLFPLQAALGYTVAQNLFISKYNLLVEGPADLLYLQFASARLEEDGRVFLRDDVVIVPVGGLDKVATFIALLGANDLHFAVLHDESGVPNQRILDMVRSKVISEKRVCSYVKFRSEQAARDLQPTDVEDMLTDTEYLKLFNGTYLTQLPAAVKKGDLPAGDRIVKRIEEYLVAQNIQLRPSGGFNHYLPAKKLIETSGIAFTESTLKRFETLFSAINTMITSE